MVANNPSKWFVSCNPVGGERLYIVARLRDKNAIQHSGNMEYHGEYSTDKEAQEAVAAKLNEEEELEAHKREKRTVEITNGDISLLNMYIWMYANRRKKDKEVWEEFARMHRENGDEDQARHAEEQAQFYDMLEGALGRIEEELKR